MHLRTIQINQQPDATIFQFIILTFIYSSTCLGRFPAHHQELNDYSGSLWFFLHIVVTFVLCSWSGRTQHDCHHDKKVKPEAATAVIELLMMGGKTPETRWAVNKRQDNIMENCCIWLVIYLNLSLLSTTCLRMLHCGHLDGTTNIQTSVHIIWSMLWVTVATKSLTRAFKCWRLLFCCCCCCWYGRLNKGSP